MLHSDVQDDVAVGYTGLLLHSDVQDGVIFGCTGLVLHSDVHTWCCIRMYRTGFTSGCI